MELLHYSRELLCDINEEYKVDFPRSAYWDTVFSNDGASITETLAPALSVVPANVQQVLNDLVFPLLNGFTGQKLSICKEAIFENVRKSFYKEKPSREKCMFLFDSQGASTDSVVKLCPDFECRQLQTFMVLDGEYLKADAKLLDCNSLSNSEITKRAHMYWKGEHLDSSPAWEVLLIGRIKRVS